VTADRANQTIILKDGRRLGFAEYGETTGKAVFHFNGSGGSRLEYPSDPSILTDLGIRLISTDRPGHGLSDPQPGRRLLDWPEDIGQLADILGIDRFHVMGWSAGGPHALACALKLPDRVLTGAIISGLAPPDRPNPYEALSFGMKTLMIIARRVPAFVYLFRRMTAKMLQGDPAKMLDRLSKSFPPEDVRAIEESGSAESLLADMQMSGRVNSTGMCR